MNALKNGNNPPSERDKKWMLADWQGQGAMNQFAGHLIKVREEERKRLANEIHDKLGQNLLALRIDVSMLHARTTDTHPRINSKADKVLSDLDIAIQNIKDIINHLRPPVIELGLLASVDWNVKEFERYSKIPCSLQINGDDAEYAAYDKHAMPMMRILQESLTNVARHASASAVDVALSNGKSELTMRVTDDGIGFQPDDLKKPDAYGLQCVMEYVRLLNGKFAINAKGHQRGTVLTVAIPGANVA